MTEGSGVANPTFGEVLEQRMLRAGLWDTTLARRIGVTRPQVFRWRTGRALPSRRNVELLQHALQASQNGRVGALDPSDHHQLLVLAGHGMPTIEGIPGVADRVELPDRCAMYANQYARRSFPTRWAIRHAEVESAVQGSMHCMLYRLPACLRPEAMMRVYERWFDVDRVDQYHQNMILRRQAMSRRLEQNEIRQIYNKAELTETLQSRQWLGVDLQRDVVREQIEDTLRLLDAHYPNLTIGLDDDPLPFGVTIVGREVALLQLRQVQPIMAPGWTVSGLELTGLSVIKTLSQAFDRAWGKRTLVKDPKAVRDWFSSLL